MSRPVPLPVRGHSTRSSSPPGVEPASGWLHPLQGRLAGQEFTSLCLQDRNDMDGSNVGFVLLTFLRRQQVLGAFVSEHVETLLELRISLQGNQLPGRLRCQTATDRFEKPAQDRGVWRLIHAT